MVKEEACYRIIDFGLIGKVGMAIGSSAFLNALENGNGNEKAQSLLPPAN